MLAAGQLPWSGLAGVFLNALLPLILMGGMGAIADRFLHFDRSSLSKFNIYVLLPPLLFSTLMTVSVDADSVLRVVGFTAIILTGMAGLGFGFARLRKLDGAATSSTVLATTFFNAINLGFPISAFAFGDGGLRMASVLVAVNAIPHNGFGMFIAARGALSTRDTLRALVRMPFFHVMALAIVLRATGTTLPQAVMTPIESVGMAALPFTIICIGMELGRMKIGKIDGTLAGIVALRLLVAPLVAIGAAEVMGLSGLLRSVVILQASMPSAIAPIVYARVFGGNVDLLSRAAFYTTLGSLITLPFLLLTL
jgi:predicted permease